MLETLADLAGGLARHEADLLPAIGVPDADRVRVERIGRIGSEREPGTGSERVVLQLLGPVRGARHFQDGDPRRCQPRVIPADGTIALVAKLIPPAFDELARPRLRRVPTLLESKREGHAPHCNPGVTMVACRRKSQTCGPWVGRWPRPRSFAGSGTRSLPS